MQIQAAVVHEKVGAIVLPELNLDPTRENEVVVRLDTVPISHKHNIWRNKYFPVPLQCEYG